jgi:aminopeptidase-like protein
MNVALDLEQRAVSSTAECIYRLAEDLYPICRSITGDGVRKTLSAIAGRIPIQVTETPTGTAVFDWTVPGSSISENRTSI